MNLSERVVAHVSDGMSRRQATAQFGVSYSLVIDWLTSLRHRALLLELAYTRLGPSSTDAATSTNGTYLISPHQSCCAAIGLATASRFAAEGARIFITGRRKPELNAAVAAIGRSAIGGQADASQPGELDRLYQQVKAEAGRNYVLFVNAGGGSMLPLGQITEAQYEDTFGRNVKGVLFTVQKALPLLVDGASVISIAGTESTPAFSVYSASKAAVRSFARNWILDLKDRHIRVNTLSPGVTRTPGLVDLAGPDAAAQQGLLDYMATKIPMGAWASQRRSQRRPFSLLPMMPASSTGLNYLSMAARLKSKNSNRV